MDGHVLWTNPTSEILRANTPQSVAVSNVIGSRSGSKHGQQGWLREGRFRGKKKERKKEAENLQQEEEFLPLLPVKFFQLFKL